MQIRKIIMFGLMMLGAFSLASCNLKEEKSTISLNIWTYYNGNIESSFQNIISQFNNTKRAEEKIVVSSVSQGSKVNDLSDALIASANKELGSDPMPDMFISC